MAETDFEPFRVLRSRTVAIAQDDIDTDQILPARFMETRSKAGLGRSLFYDWRHFSSGDINPDHLLNRIHPSSHRILVVGRNFGSGSSREHAPWALVDFGFQALIGLSFADIFANNAVQNGLLTIVVPKGLHQHIVDAGELSITIDLEAQTITLPGEGAGHPFKVEPFARRCLLEGLSSTSWLVRHMDAIERFENQRTHDARGD
ncbi:3-isopropylmalate dehydratase small subunit [Caulobacter sp. SSI4214]|uniref:3-isopropylmalate dehydratase small subunit n=1 Tax=Caulobacter sp. SSI4214 TaxID=2575739 RepID=UPI00143C5EBB|nr:3-isopropylmalate dehydratase small subunit [Caulobacter sp. SSI4214]